MTRNTRNLVIGIGAALAILGLRWITSRSLTPLAAVYAQAEGTFAPQELVHQVEMGEGGVLVLYTGASGNLYAANVEKKLFYYNVDKFTGSIQFDMPGELEKGQVRVRLILSSPNKGNHYIIYGVILDDAVKRVDWVGQTLQEVDLLGRRIVYGYGEGREFPDGSYTLYDANGAEMGHRFGETLE